MTTQPKALDLDDDVEDWPELRFVTDTECREVAAELRRLHTEVESLKLAEEGAKEAYSVLVDDKRDLKKELDRMTELHRSNLDMTRNALREKMRLEAMNAELRACLIELEPYMHEGEKLQRARAAIRKAKGIL